MTSLLPTRCSIKWCRAAACQYSRVLGATEDKGRRGIYLPKRIDEAVPVGKVVDREMDGVGRNRSTKSPLRTYVSAEVCLVDLGCVWPQIHVKLVRISEVGRVEKTGRVGVARAHRNRVQTPTTDADGRAICGKPGGREVVVM